VYSSDSPPKQFIRNNLDVSDIPGTKRKIRYLGKAKDIMNKYKGLEDEKRVRKSLEYDNMNYSDVIKKKLPSQRIDSNGYLYRAQKSSISQLGEHSRNSIEFKMIRSESNFHTNF
jgi:hypothetical protein